MNDAYRLLSEFASTFRGQVYRHRASTTGDTIAGKLYEDLYELGRSPLFRARVDAKTHGVSRRNAPTGIRVRRGDGAFGDFVPNIAVRQPAGRLIATGPLAAIEIGAEMKILQKAMIKQIDRVMNDMCEQAKVFRQHGAPICIGLVGVNHAEVCTSYEADRPFRTDGSKYRHPIQEAPEAIRRLQTRVAPQYDELLILPYSATNEEPFPFSWQSPQTIHEQYGALLLRVSKRYDECCAI